MTNLNMKDFLTTLRSNVESCAKYSQPEDTEGFMAAFDRATAETVVDLVDGATQEPKKPRKPRTPRAPQTPPAE